MINYITSHPICRNRRSESAQNPVKEIKKILDFVTHKADEGYV